MAHIEHFLDHLAAERGFSPHTVKAYRRDLEAFARHLKKAGRSLTKADRESVSAFLSAEHRRGASWATVGRRLAALRSFYAFLTAEGAVRNSPAGDVPMPRTGERLPKALIHRNVPGESVHALLRDLDAAWDRAAPHSAFGSRARFVEAVSTLVRSGRWPIEAAPRRWRLGELTVDWAAVAPR